MPDEVLFDYFSNTKLSESSDMAKSWQLFVAQDIIKVKNYSVAELREYMATIKVQNLKTVNMNWQKWHFLEYSL